MGCQPPCHLPPPDGPNVARVLPAPRTMLLCTGHHVSHAVSSHPPGAPDCRLPAPTALLRPLLFPPPSNLLSLSPGGGHDRWGLRGGGGQQKNQATRSKSLGGVHTGNSDCGAWLHAATETPPTPHWSPAWGIQSLLPSSFTSMPLTSVLLCLASWHSILPHPTPAPLSQALLYSHTFGVQHTVFHVLDPKEKNIYFPLAYQF